MKKKRTETAALIRRAKKGRGFLYPEYSKTARLIIIIIGGLYLRFVEGVKKVSFFNEERIISSMKGFHDGEHRLIFVFRHAAEEDPPVLMYAFTNALRRKIETKGKSSHLRFLYGRDVPNWAGPAAAWLFPRIGAIPVQNRGNNSAALNILRREMLEGAFPVILAPEEQVVYHMYRTSELAPGISSLVKWGAESGKPVTVVPLALGYTYGHDPERFIRGRLSEWEKLTGLRLENRENGGLHPLLVEAADKTILLLENYYGLPSPEETERRDPDMIDRRIAVLCDAILTAAEETSGLTHEGGGMDRLFRIRYAGVDAFYPEDVDPAELAVMPRAFLDFNSLKAEVSIRHSQIVDVLEYISLKYIDPPFSAGRGCEFVLNLLDLINRADGGDIGGRYSPAGQHAAVFAGEPLIFDRNPDAGMNRRDHINKIRDDIRKALQTASEGLEQEWEKIILE